MPIGKNIVFIPLFAIFLLVAFKAGAADSQQLQQLLHEADSNPSLRAAYEQIAVAEAKVPQVESLPDPILSLSLSSYPVDSLRSDQAAMTGNEIKLAQMFPFPGKLDAKGKVAADKSRWFAAAYQDARLQVRSKVKDAWFRLLFQRQAIALTKHNLTLLDDFIKLTETRYEVGKGLQQNVLKAHLQRSKQLDKLLALQQQEEATQAELNSLAGRDTAQNVETDEKLESDQQQFELAALQQQAQQNRPLFQAFDALIDQYQAQRKLAKLDYRPDVTLWGSYRFRDDNLADGGTDFASVGLSFNLPVHLKRRAAAVAEADSSLRMAYQKRNDFHNQVNLTLHRQLTRFEQAGKLAKLYQSGIIPQADQTFQATMSAYQVDKVDFLDLLDSLMTLYRYQIDYIKALSDQQRSLAGIEAAAGLALEQLPETSIEG